MDLEWVIYHMIHNDDEQFTSVSFDVDICRGDDDQWDRLLAGLSRSQTLTRLDLVRGLQLRVATEADLQQLFEATRQIPHLSEIRLDCFSTEDIEHAESLFVGNDTIHSVLIENVRVVRNARNGNRYDGVVENLAAIHRLRSLHVEISTEMEPVELPFARLLQFETSKVESLIIESTSSLPIFEPHFQLMARALSTPNSLLQILDIDLQISPSGLEEVSAMLTVNNALKVLRLHVHPSIQELPEVTERFLHVLKSINQSLNKFVNYGLLSYIPTPNMIKAEFEMLEANLFLESFAIFNEDHDVRAKRAMYLRLNERGRKLVYLQPEKASKGIWISQLARHSDDLDCLFYYIGTNPTLCRLDDPPTVQTTELSVKKEQEDDVHRIGHSSSRKKVSTLTRSMDDKQRESKRQRT